jgi:hypothetical protein
MGSLGRKGGRAGDIVAGREMELENFGDMTLKILVYAV